jgi:hypothetical protein
MQENKSAFLSVPQRLTVVFCGAAPELVAEAA